MKALTLTQPWASLVAIGAKRIETRSWSTRYRGALAIHAAQGFPGDARCTTWSAPPFLEVLEAAGYHFEPMLVQRQRTAPGHDLPLGAVVAVANLADCIPAEDAWTTDQEFAFGDFSPGRYAWFLEDVHRIEPPIPAKGALGLWEWETTLSELEMHGLTVPRARAVIDRLQAAFQELEA